MKIKHYILFILLSLSQLLTGQSHPYEVKFSYQIESELADGKISPSRAGLLYSLIGDYSNSIQYSDIPVSWGIDTLELSGYSIKGALSKIVEEAQNHQIVIISENHLKPQHRVFADKVIGELAEIGFEHLGLETFTSISNNNSLLDSTLTERGYPLNSPLTGTYTLEPQMGKLVRNAISSKMNLFAYERSKKIKGKDRDEIQAENIIKYLRSNPNSKIVILCGLHHAIESSIIKRGDNYWMAKYLKAKLDIDPMTIYQDNFTEKQIENQHPILESINIAEPSVFVDKTGRIQKLSKHVDIEVIHPNTRFVNNRPNWLYNGGKNKALKPNTEITDLDFPIIVEAYPMSETNSVPVDRIELKHKYDNKVLVLKKGVYRIVLKDKEQIIEYNETIE